MALIIIVAFIMASAFIDAEHLLDKDYIENHRSRFIQRVAFIAALSLYSLPVAVGGIFLFIALFDGLLNYFWGKDVFYIGDTAKWDKFWKDKKVLLIMVKVISIILGVLLISS
jgi:hypothetical protein